MYFDIVSIVEPDEYGNTVTRLEAVTVAPEYPDITPKDMSLSNQLKAGITPDRSGLMPIGDKLNASDAATSQLFESGEQLIPVESPKRSESTNPTLDSTSDSKPKYE